MSHRVKSWLDWYFDLFRGYYVLGMIVPPLLLFGIGAGISWSIKFLDIYLQTLPIYLGVIGFFWSLIWLNWVRKRIHTVCQEIRPAFLVKDEDFDQLCLLWIQRLLNKRLHFSVSIILMLIGWLALVLVTRFGVIGIFPTAWSEGPYLWAKNLVLCLYIVPVALMISTGGAFIITFAFFVISLTRLPLVPLIEITRIILRPLASVGLILGFAWSSGVSLFVIWFRPEFNPVCILSILLLTMIGLTMILWPQYALHRGLQHTKQHLLSIAFIMLYNSLGLDTTQKLDVIADHLVKHENQQIINFIRSLIETQTWIYDPRDIPSILGVWVLPIASLAISKLF